MPVNNETINKNLYDVLRSRGYDPISLDSKGDPTDEIENADVFRFTYKDIDRRKKGQAWVTVEGNELVLYVNDNFVENPDFENFSQFMKRWSQKRLLGFKITNKDHLIGDMKKRTVMKKKDGLNEGYYPLTKKSSYSDNIPQVKMIIQHTRQLEEGEQRYRNVDKIFVENASGERFLVPTTRPGLARVYARHIAEGGTPYDDKAKHITTLIEEYSKMAGFVRATRNGQFNESALKLVNEGLLHYNNLRMTLQGMTSHRGYNKYFESYTPMLNEETDDTTTINELFVQEKLDPRIESVLPILNRLNKNITEMSEVKELEEWATDVTGEQVDEMFHGGFGGQSKFTKVKKPKASAPKKNDEVKKELARLKNLLLSGDESEKDYARGEIARLKGKMDEGMGDDPTVKRLAAMDKLRKAGDLATLKNKAGQQQAGSAAAKYYKDKVTKAEKPADKEVPDFLKKESVSEGEERPYVCVHARKGKYECTASSSYAAAQKAAQHWKLKSTAGIDAHLADVVHKPVNEGTLIGGIFSRKPEEVKAALEKLRQIKTLPAKGATKVLGNIVFDDELYDIVAEYEINKPDTDMMKVPAFVKRLRYLTGWAKEEQSDKSLDEGDVVPFGTKPMGMSDEVAAKKIAAKLLGTPDITIPKLKSYIVKYLPMVGKSPKDVEHLTALVYHHLHADDDLVEDLGPEQKKVGQLGPTEKVKNNNIGKLVGANESAELETLKALSGIK